MKRTSFYHLLTATALCLILLCGCKQKVYLNDTDLTAEIDMGMALPVGTMSATIGDFLGGDQIEGLYIDSMNHRGVFTYRGNYTKQLYYHNVDLSQYISSTTLTQNVSSKLQQAGLLHNHYINATGRPFTLAFPMTLHLNGINTNEDYERLDSALIKNANFTSIIQPNNLPLQWQWIDKVTIELGENEFTRPAGNIITVYDKTKNKNYNYGTRIPITVDEFSLCLMDNKNPKNLAQYFNNVKDSCNFTIRYTITIPASQGQIYIPDDAAFDYSLQVQFIDYYAIWGMFEPSSDMHDEDEIATADEWETWTKFTQATLPFAAPTADVNLTTQVAGALRIFGDYLYVRDKSGKRQDVTLGQQYNPYYFKEGEYLPLNSQIGDSATMTIHFDQTPTNGHIDQLFSVRPDYVGYKYHIDFHQQATPQIRITPNTGILFSCNYTLPFIFNQGLALQYADTIKDLDFSSLNLDSLLASVETLDSLKTSELKLFIKLQNTIQLGMQGIFRALDENEQQVIDPTTGKPFMLTSSDTIAIQPPTFTYQNGAWLIDQPHEQVQIISLNKDKLDVLAQIKSIAFTATIDDKALDNTFQQGNFNTKLTNDAALKIGIGITAQVDAIFNFNTTEE